MTEYRVIPPRFVPERARLRQKIVHERHLRPGKSAALVLAFTLVEVALSLGIISSGAVVLIGMLPVALSVSRQAMDSTIESQIAQKMISEALQTDFSNLPNLATGSSSLYFDEQGNQSTQTLAIYQAGIAVSTSTPLPVGAITKKLATVSICILNTKAGRTSTESDPTKNPDSKKFVVLIPDNGL